MCGANYPCVAADIGIINPALASVSVVVLWSVEVFFPKAELFKVLFLRYLSLLLEKSASYNVYIAAVLLFLQVPG